MAKKSRVRDSRHTSVDATPNEEGHKSFTILLSAPKTDDEEIVSFQGFRSPWWKKLIFYLVGVVTAGFSFLVCKWSPRFHIFLSLAPCPLKQAQYVRIQLADGRVDLEKVQEVALADPMYDSHPADEEDGGRGGLLDWQVQRVHKLLEYRCTRYFYVGADQYSATTHHDLAPDRASGGVPNGGVAGPGGAGAPAIAKGGGMFVPVPAVPRGFNDQLLTAAVTLAATGQATAVEEQQDWDLAERQLRYGANEMRIPVKTIPMLIFDEMWHPFYVFQYFSILVWVVGDQYYAYAVCIAAITWFSIISAAVEAHSNMKRLADIAHFECEVEVLRSGELVRLPSSTLVPGDLVVVGPGTLPCDMVLLRGECILDENMLTGESVPVRKVPYNPVADGLSYDPDKCPGCTLFGGTVVAQARASRGQKAVAVVCRTRFYSAKGQLLRSILFPREHEESFISDSLRFIVVMLVACLALYVWAAAVLLSIGASPDRIVVRFFDMITVAVPPALPACLTIATVFSIGRLRKKGIYVTSPDRITLAGQLDVICFDKTGTLTEQGLDLQGIVPIVDGRLHNLVAQVSLLPVSLVELLASCHGLARMGDSLVGDPLDQKLFLATHWDLIDERPSMEAEYAGAYGNTTGTDSAAAAAAANGLGLGGGIVPEVAGGIDGAVGLGAAGGAAEARAASAEATGTGDVHTYVRPPGAVHAFAIIKRFEFSAALQRNLVVVRAPDNSVAVFAKGSPEAIRTLVAPASVPANFDSLLGELTREGLRVLALAAGDATAVPEPTLLGWTQTQTEGGVGLRLVGLAVMANPLRPDTADVIARLQHATIRTVMVTGDHLRTAISVAHKCNILPPQRPILLLDAADPPPPPSNPQPPSSTSAAAAAAAVSPTPPAPPTAVTNGPPTPAGIAAVRYPTAPLPVVRVHSAGSGGGDGDSPPASHYHLHFQATGPGPAGEPTPMGDPSISLNSHWGAALLTEGAADGVGQGLRPGAATFVISPDEATWALAPPQAAALPEKAAVTTVPGGSLLPAQNGATAVVAAVAPPPVAASGGGLRLSVLDADGNVTETTTAPASASPAAAIAPPSSSLLSPAPSPASHLLAQVVTGDLECAVTGKGFSWLLASLDPAMLLPVLQRAAVFARMSPDNKRDLMLLLGSGIDGVEACPHLGLRAGFCGDGANDCGALKAAHVGVSLCEAEASVAAPMTSKAQTIASMITVVAEGRCTLMATYQIFQFIIAYALVQAFETNLMYTYALNIGNYQYLIEDLFFTTVLAALMGFTEPRSKLSRTRPLSRVMSLPLLISTAAQCVVTVVVFQLASLALLQNQPGYVRFQGGPELHDTVAPENTVTYIVALAQFVVLALVFNKGKPHRSPIWTNVWLVLALVVQSAFVVYSLFSTDKFNTEVQQLVDRISFGGIMNTGFRWKLFGLIVVMGVSSFLAEYASIGLVKAIEWARGSRSRGGSIPATVPGAPRMDRLERSRR